MRYIALLRGINVSGKNKVDMAGLRQLAVKLGFTQVKTLLNSGNLAFNSEPDDTADMTALLRRRLLEEYKLDIPVLIMPQMQLQALLETAPEWWGVSDDGMYHNLIMILGTESAAEMADCIGPVSENLEQVALGERSIFWSFDRAQYQKARWWKRTAAAGIGERLTIRNASTMQKLAVL